MPDRTVDLPDWADASLSAELPNLRAQGEGQKLEYKASFPANVSNLAKEIAAFSTSNAGTILVGVADSGDLVGLDDALDSKGRDAILRRLDGICRGTVKPAVTPKAAFAVEQGKSVLVIRVPEGRQPVYYSNNIPYIRHLTSATPAEPHEVIELIQRSDALSGRSQTATEDDSQLDFNSRLLNILIDVDIAADEVSERTVNPWLDQWRTEFEYAASDMRDLAAEEIAVNLGMADEFVKVADALDKVADLRLAMGRFPELQNLAEQAQEKSRALRQQYLSDVQFDEDSLRQIRSMITTTTRKLDILVDNTKVLIEAGRTEELQSTASKLGRELLRIAHHNIDSFGDEVNQEFLRIGRQLHLTETMGLFLDGGSSYDAVAKHVENLRDHLVQTNSELSE